MNQETNDFLKENLEEAHITFNTIIAEMRDNNISIDYKKLITAELNSYNKINDILNKMSYSVLRREDLLEENSELFEEEYRCYIKYIALYIVTLLFIRLYHEIIDTSKMSDILKYVVGLFLGSSYIGLLNKDIHDNRSDTKEKRDLINELKTMKEEYKKDHDTAVSEIDNIFGLNSGLWNILDKEKTKHL